MPAMDDWSLPLPSDQTAEGRGISHDLAHAPADSPPARPRLNRRVESIAELDRRSILTHELDGSVAALRAIARVMGTRLEEWERRSPGLADAVASEADRLAMLADDARELRGVPPVHERVAVDFDLADVADLAGRYVRLMQPGRPVVIDLPADRVGMRGDPGRLGQVIRNLLDNALRYAGPESPVELALDHGVDDDGAWAAIRVIDFGPGVAPDDRDRIFLPRARGSWSHRSRGDGLGLFLCRELVGGLGGQLWHEETPGGGATFVVLLPLGRATDRSDITQPAGTNAHERRLATG